jgi:hypothetical protein
LFDFDSREKEREEMEAGDEDEALLLKAFQGIPACVGPSFDADKRVSDYENLQEADKAITLSKKLNGPRCLVTLEHILLQEEALFDSGEVWVSRQKLEDTKKGCVKAVKRAMEAGRRAAASAGLKVISDQNAEMFLSCL